MDPSAAYPTAALRWPVVLSLRAKLPKAELTRPVVLAESALNPNADDPDLELDRFRRKIDAGAKFAMTQIVYDLDHLDRFLDRLGGPSPIPVLVGIFPLTTYRLALRLHNEVPGIVVPDDLQEQLREAGPHEAEVGFAHARALLAAARDRAAGVYVVAPYKKPLSVLELIAH